jgi:hypothetical protein
MRSNGVSETSCSQTKRSLAAELRQRKSARTGRPDWVSRTVVQWLRRSPVPPRRFSTLIARGHQRGR